MTAWRWRDTKVTALLAAVTLSTQTDGNMVRSAQIFKINMPRVFLHFLWFLVWTGNPTARHPPFAASCIPSSELHR